MSNETGLTSELTSNEETLLAACRVAVRHSIAISFAQTQVSKLPIDLFFQAMLFVIFELVLDSQRSELSMEACQEYLHLLKESATHLEKNFSYDDYLNSLKHQVH